MKEFDTKSENDSQDISFVGLGYSSLLLKKDFDEKKLLSAGLPIVHNARELAEFLAISFEDLGSLSFHHEIVKKDNYWVEKRQKKTGGYRDIAKPKPHVKRVQRAIYDKLLALIPVSDHAHGFKKGKSAITSAKVHPNQPMLVLMFDIKDFFPTILFERVRGLFCGLGYSGYISTLFAMLCTYCERKPVDIKGKTRFMALGHRILPQGSPSSPAISNIICRCLDNRLSGLARKFGLIYTRYADDIIFSLRKEHGLNIGRFSGMVKKILREEGFAINANKTTFMSAHTCQKMLGLVKNEQQIGLPRKWAMNFRAAIYNAKESKENGNLTEKTKERLRGMAAWAKSVNERRYEKLIHEALNVIN